jgi:signal transduction histidine kinase
MNIDILGRETRPASQGNSQVNAQINLPAVLASCSELLERAISETRTISHLLHPPLLDEVGLLSAMNWFVEGFSKRSGIQTNMDLPAHYDRLPQETEITLFRVLQEALTNVHRHSGSSKVDITLRITTLDVWLEVKDYGHGIPEERLKQVQDENAQIGVGLAGMKERVRQLEGSLEITSGSKGTTVSVRIPVPEIEKVSVEAQPAMKPPTGVSAA